MSISSQRIPATFVTRKEQRMRNCRTRAISVANLDFLAFLDIAEQMPHDLYLEVGEIALALGNLDDGNPVGRIFLDNAAKD